MHREYINPFPAKFIIEKNQIKTENANKPHGHGKINLKNFSPYPKNPIIARVFKEIGFADELGSGIRNLTKYVKIYSNADPKLIENDIFNIIIPLKEQDTPQEKILKIVKMKEQEKKYKITYLLKIENILEKHY